MSTPPYSVLSHALRYPEDGVSLAPWTKRKFSYAQARELAQAVGRLYGNQDRVEVTLPSDGALGGIDYALRVMEHYSIAWPEVIVLQRYEGAFFSLVETTARAIIDGTAPVPFCEGQTRAADRRGPAR